MKVLQESLLHLIKGTTRIVGIFGDPVTYTLSPKMHNHAFEKLKLDYVYVPFRIKPEKLKNAVEAIRSLNLAGVNVTIPHKQTILPFLDSLSPEARSIEAVNTIVNQDGKLIGHNTDSSGFLSSLREEGSFDPRDKNAVLLGAGGAAHAIAAALLEGGLKKLVITNRTVEKAKNLAHHLSQQSNVQISVADLSSDLLADELKHCDLFLNATPSGIAAKSFSIRPETFLSPKVFVFDAVYSEETPLLSAARSAGARSISGLEMLIHQGALSFSIWTGLKPPVELMRESLYDD